MAQKMLPYFEPGLIFDPFVGGNINFRILSPTNGSKIGKNNPQKTTKPDSVDRLLKDETYLEISVYIARSSAPL